MRREADAWAQQRATELRAMKGGRAGTVKTLRDALREYAEKVTPTKRGWAKEMIRLKAFEGPAHARLPTGKRLAEVTTADLAAWRDARLAAVARGSVLRDLTLLSNVFEVARREWGWVDSNVCSDVRRPVQPDHREVVITGPQIRRVLRSLGWRRAPARTVSQAVGNAFLLALMTGMRAGEICALTPEDIRADHCILRTSKTGAGRAVPLLPTALRVIGFMGDFGDDRVFGLTAQTLDAMFRKARMRSGLEGFTFHDSRHTAATRLAQRLHVLDLCKMFGWKSTTRALTYYNPKASDIARRLSGAAAPTRSPH
jgi:integrase